MSRLFARARSAFPPAVRKAVRRGFGAFRKKAVLSGSAAYFHANLRPGDTFLVGHPKSGNTWLAYLLAVLINDDREGKINTANVGRYVPTIHSSDHQISKFQNLRSPRVFRNENPIYPDLYPKTIYIVRDPRAVLLSYYHHSVHDTGETDWRIGDFVDEMLSEGCIRRLEPTVTRWDTQVEDWKRRSTRQPVRIIRYEDLKLDTGGVLEILQDFLEVSSPVKDLASIVERGQFKNMRAEEKRFGAESYPGEKGEKGFFVRKGKVDSWKEEMPPDVVSRIELAFENTMRNMGYIE